MGSGTRSHGPAPVSTMGWVVERFHYSKMDGESEMEVVG
jgi:hypothetical protein